MQGGGVMAKTDANPVNPVQRLRDARRCTATSKRTKLPCQAPAVRGWRVCRFHGAGGGQPAGKAHPGYKHGLRSREFVEMRKLVSQLGRDAKRRVASLALATVSLLI